MSETSTAPAEAPATESATEAKGGSPLPIIIGLVILLIGGGVTLKILIDKDKALCEADYAKGFAITKTSLDRSHGEYHVHLAGVTNRGAYLKEWTATYNDETVAIKGEESSEGKIVSQYSRKTKRHGMLGSDLKRLYGGTYKHYTFMFYVKHIDDEPHKLTIKGVVHDPVFGKDVPFEEEVELQP